LKAIRRFSQKAICFPHCRSQYYYFLK